jgi:hypothetical protein
MRSKRLNALLIIAVLMAFAGTGAAFMTAGGVKSRLISFQLDSGGKGWGILTVPASVSLDRPSEEAFDKPPVVFLLPGIISLADRFGFTSEELARRGYASFAIYFPSDNNRQRLGMLQAAVLHIEQAYPQLNSSMRAYYGHSLGGSTAVDAAYSDPNARAAVSAGYYIGGELAGSPKNLLIGTGIYDDLNDREKMRSSIRSVTDGRVSREGVFEGDFAALTARELFISPYSNHASEKEDGFVIRRLIEWLDMSFHGSRSPGRALLYPVRIFAVFAATVGFFILLCIAGVSLRRKGAPLVTALWLTFYVAVAMVSLMEPETASVILKALSVISASWLIANYLSEREKGTEGDCDAMDSLASGLISFAAKASLFALAFSLSQFIFSVSFFLEDRRFLTAFPGYLYFTFFITGWSYIDSCASYARNFLPGAWIGFMAAGIVIAALDSLRPGCVASVLTKACEKLRAFLKFRQAQHVPPGQKAALAALCVLMVISWLWLYRSGFLYGELMMTYILFVLRYAVVPVALFGLFGAGLSAVRKRH